MSGRELQFTGTPDELARAMHATLSIRSSGRLFAIVVDGKRAASLITADSAKFDRIAKESPDRIVGCYRAARNMDRSGVTAADIAEAIAEVMA